MRRIEADRNEEGEEGKKRERIKGPGREYILSVVRGTLLSEPVAAMSGTASVRAIRQRVSGSSPSHFVPPSDSLKA